jgi:hypothetical protein
MQTNEIAYIAGLFDGEVSIYYKKTTVRRKTRKNTSDCWQIRMELAMTDKDVVEWVWKTLARGTFGERKVTNKGIKGVRKRQWRWRCGYRDALYVCKLLWPFAQVKLHKIEKIIDHYEPHIFDGNVVSLSQYKDAMSLE